MGKSRRNYKRKTQKAGSSRKIRQNRYTLKGGDKQEACRQLWEGVSGSGGVGYSPQEMAPGLQPDLSLEVLQKWLAFIPSLKKGNLLLFVIGDPFYRDILQTKHNVKNDDFIKSWGGKITVINTDLANNGGSMESYSYATQYGPKYVDEKHSRDTFYEIDKSKINLEGFEDKIESFFIGNLPFPYTPLSNRTRYTERLSPIYASKVFPKSLALLHELVKHPSPIFIDSSMTGLCFRSFKYLIDIRKKYGRLTKVIAGYTEGQARKCNDEYPIFPRPWKACNFYDESGVPKDEYLNYMNRLPKRKLLFTAQENFLESAASNPNFNVLEKSKNLFHEKQAR